MRSPYPELTGAEYQLFVDLWEDEESAGKQLSARYHILDDQSGLEYLRRFRRRGLRAWLDRRLHGPALGEDPFDVVYRIHAQNRAGVYL